MVKSLFQTLTVVQLKTFSGLIDEAIKQTLDDCAATEHARNEKLKEIGNLVHDSVPVSKDEVNTLFVCSKAQVIMQRRDVYQLPVWYMGSICIITVPRIEERCRLPYKLAWPVCNMHVLVCL